MHRECAALKGLPKHLALLAYTDAAQCMGAYVRWRTELETL